MESIPNAIMECLVDGGDAGNHSFASLTTDVVTKEATRFAMLFYVMDPSVTTFQHISQIPDYFNFVAPSVVCLFITEIIARWYSDSMENCRSNDVIASLGSAILYMAISGPTRTIEILLYHYAYEKRFFTFDWESPVTWWIAAISVDFFFYWFHRFAHETNIGWAGHQVHHGSEDYNLTTSVRQSALLKLYTIIFYLPMGLIGVPLSATLVHMQLNIIYQMWLHTEMVSTVGPLEWIFNTPSHHRVHHGSEPWCLDKNYGGVLVIWDRMFGTFQPEIKDRQLIYGLVDQPQSMNVIYLETFYLKNVYKKFMSQTNWKDKLKSVFYGPGWMPGSPRLGHPLPEPDEGQPKRKKYDPQLPRILELYLLVHFVIAAFVQKAVMINYQSLHGVSVVFNTMYTLCTMGVIGGMYDGWSGSMMLEVFRCSFYIVYSSFFPIFNNVIVDRLLIAYLAFSIIIWSFQSVNRNYSQNKWIKKFI